MIADELISLNLCKTASRISLNITYGLVFNVLYLNNVGKLYSLEYYENNKSQNCIKDNNCILGHCCTNRIQAHCWLTTKATGIRISITIAKRLGITITIIIMTKNHYSKEFNWSLLMCWQQPKTPITAKHKNIDTRKIL